MQLQKERSMERQPKQPERHLVFIDGDRCFWNSERFMDIIYEKLELRGISRGEMADIKKETEATGGSFDTFEALRAMYDGALIDQLAEEVEEEAASRAQLPYEDPRCLLMPGARELVASIAPGNRIFLTRGGEEMQLMKLRGIAGVDVNNDLFEITNRDDKGRMLVESYHPDRELFVFRWVRNAPGDLEATHATLVEDKGKAFAGLEQLGDRVSGYWYQDPNEPQLLSQRLPEGMVLPDTVEVVDSLFAVRDSIRLLGTTALNQAESTLRSLKKIA